MTKITKLKTMLLTLLLCLVGVSEMQAHTTTCYVYTNGSGWVDSGTWSVSQSGFAKAYGSKTMTANPNSGYYFSGWSNWWENSYGYDCSYSLNGNHITVNLTAVNSSDYACGVTANFSPCQYTVTFNPNGGTITNSGNIQNVGSNGCGSVTTTYDASSYCYMGSSGNPYRDGYTFAGWYDAADGGNQVYDAAGCCTSNGNYWSGSCTSSQLSWTPKWKHTGSVTLFAHWTAAPKISDEGAVTFVEDAPVTPAIIEKAIENIETATAKTDFDLSNTVVTADDAKTIVKTIRESANGKNAFIFLPNTADEIGDSKDSVNVITTEGTTSTCQNLNLVDGTPMVSALVGKKFTAESATYTRPNLKSDWGTICLPYPVKSDNEIQYYKLKKVNGSTMSFEAVNEEQAANTPLVFKRKNSNITTINPTRSGAEISVQNSQNVDNQEYYLVGTYTPIQLSNSRTDCFYIASNKFWCTSQAADKVTIPAYRAYFTTTNPNPSGAKAFSIAIWDGDVTTAIGTIDANGDIQITDYKYMQDGKVVIVNDGKKYNTTGQTIK